MFLVFQTKISGLEADLVLQTICIMVLSGGEASDKQ
jgi:hypothetical protein